MPGRTSTPKPVAREGRLRRPLPRNLSFGARRLMTKLVRRQMQRNETPFLHVMHDNADAHQLYRRMGFVDYRESVVRVISLR